MTYTQLPLVKSHCRLLSTTPSGEQPQSSHPKYASRLKVLSSHSSHLTPLILGAHWHVPEQLNKVYSASNVYALNVLNFILKITSFLFTSSSWWAVARLAVWKIIVPIFTFCALPSYYIGFARTLSTKFLTFKTC